MHIAAAIATAAGSQLMKLLLAACREEDLPQVARIPNKDGYNPVHMTDLIQFSLIQLIN